MRVWIGSRSDCPTVLLSDRYTILNTEILGWSFFCGMAILSAIMNQQSDIKMKSWIPRDTTQEAMLKQYEVLRRIGPMGRAAMTFELSDNVRSMVEAGVRSRHPDWDTARVSREVVRLMIGEDLFRRVLSARGASS